MERSSQYKNANDKVTEMTSLSSLTTQAVKDGYTANFKVAQGKLCAPDGKCYTADNVTVVNFYRFEGESDPGDNTILYVIETNDGMKGTLINAMGAYADENINKFMADVDEMHKKPIE